MIFIYPEASASIHFLFFHHHDQTPNNLLQSTVINDVSFDCNYDEVKYAPFTKTQIGYHIFHFIAEHKVQFHICIEPELKKRYRFNLRAPPDCIFNS